MYIAEESASVINPNLGRGLILSSLLVSFNDSETVKVVTMAFSSIQKHFIRDIRAKFGILNSLQSPDIGQNSDGGIFDFQISG